MTMRDFIPWNRGRDIPWNRGRDVAVRRGEMGNPFLTLHREMNRLFDEAFRGFDFAPFGGDRFFDRPSSWGWNDSWTGGWTGWPHVEVSETENEFKVTAELAGLDEKDVDVHLHNGVLVIKGEKKTETGDKDRLFSERYYGRFERRIPVDDIEADKVTATFTNGVLTVTLPKSATARDHMKRIAINAGRRDHKIEHQKAA
jgi:HSP20 family protein